MSQSQQRLYQCEFCNFTAKQKRNLEAHKSTHTGEKPHVCPNDDCDSAFADPSALVRHRKAKHGYETKSRNRTSPQLPAGDVFVQDHHFGGSPGQSPYAVQNIPHQPPHVSPYSTSSPQPGNAQYSSYSPGHGASQTVPYTASAYYRPSAVQDGSIMGSNHSQGASTRTQEHAPSSGYSFASSQNGPQYSVYGELVNYAYHEDPSGWPNAAVYPVQSNNYGHQQQWPGSYGSTN